MNSSQHSSTFSRFTNRKDVDYALNKLNSAGFSREQISIVTKDGDRNAQLSDTDTSIFVCDTARTGVPIAAITGSLLGAISGCLIGLGILVVPEVSSFVAHRTSLSVLAVTLAGAGVGIASGSLVEAIASLGILENQNRVYGELPFSQNDYLVIVYGTDDEVRRAESCLELCWKNRGR